MKLKNPPPRNCGKLGNAAKLREALVQVQKKVAYLCGNLNAPGSLVAGRMEINGIINAALAAPPRNCDKYDAESCRMAYHLHGDGLMTMQAFADWMFAPATESEVAK